MSLTVYCAAPITGGDYRSVFAYFENAKRVLESYGMDIRVLHPMVGKEVLLRELEAAESVPDGGPVCTPQAIFQRDRWMIRESNVTYLNLAHADAVSIGCCMELAIANTLGKHTVLVMPEDSCHQHAFVLAAADIIFPSEDEALDYLTVLAEGC